jgi:uncharacterized iron-regulated membrane protein
VKATLGLILILAGGVTIVYGIGLALYALMGLYQGAVENPMGQPATAEKDTSEAMIRAAIIGACGVPFFIAGSVLLKVSFFQRALRKRTK